MVHGLARRVRENERRLIINEEMRREHIHLEWSNDDLCDSMSTTKEDLEFNCMIITMRSEDQSLCLKRVSCTEKHPFICESELGPVHLVKDNCEVLQVRH